MNGQEDLPDGIDPAGGGQLFVYGTLRLPQVQREVIGRLVPGRPALLPGWRLAEQVIDDPSVVGLSGQAVHPIAVPSADPTDEIAGECLELTAAELLAVDDYEVSAYQRVRVTVADGTSAWFYSAG